MIHTAMTRNIKITPNLPQNTKIVVKSGQMVVNDDLQ